MHALFDEYERYFSKWNHSGIFKFFLHCCGFQIGPSNFPTSTHNVKIIWILCTTLSFSIFLGGIICGVIYWKYCKNALVLLEIQKGMFNFVVVLIQSPTIFLLTFWFWWPKPLIWHVSYIMYSLKKKLFYLNMISWLNKLVMNYVPPCRICKTSVTYIVYNVLKVAAKDFHHDNKLKKAGLVLFTKWIYEHFILQCWQALNIYLHLQY